MAIQHRRGAFTNFDPSRLLPGEWAVVLNGDDVASDGKAVYICFAPGDVKRISTYSDMAEYMDQMTEEVIEEITAEVEAATQAATEAAGDATEAASEASSAATAAQAAAEAAEAIVDYNVPLMSSTQRGGAKLGAGLQVGADEKLGVKVDGTTITVDADGTMHGASTYTLPTMSASQKGGAKLGDGLSVEDDTLNLGPLVKHSTGATDGSALYGVQGEGYATQSGTPTPDNPQPIMVARGRNLLNESTLKMNYALNSAGDEVSADGFACSDFIPVEQNANYYGTNLVGSTWLRTACVYNASKSFLRVVNLSGADNATGVINVGADAAYIKVNCSVPRIGTCQLEQGTTPTPYVPYGHVGLEVTANGQTTVTPIPLPSKGFLGALPDGTKDTLAIDSAGGVVVGNVCNETVLNGSSPEDWHKTSSKNGAYIYASAYGVGAYAQIKMTHFPYYASSEWQSREYICTVDSNAIAVGFPSSFVDTSSSVAPWLTWLASNPVTMLYPLATPTTEQVGYIDLPALPEGATVTCPELDNVGVDYWVKGIPEVTEYGQAMQARLQGEIDEAEQAIADLAAFQSAMTLTKKPVTVQSLTSGTMTSFTATVDGLYFVRAVNTSSGECFAALMWSQSGNDDDYISVVPTTTGSYIRATTAPIFLKAGTSVVARAIFTSSGAVCRIA